jgi:peptidoglycan L-alanyl-D-glutamate endopeptidase CwlK
MPTSNRIEDLHPDLAKLYAEAKAAYIAANPGGLKPRLGETYRPDAVQLAYYAQGRKPLAEVNRLRHIAGLYLLGPVEAKRVITKAQPGQSAHGFLPARAFDVQLLKPDGSIDWSEGAYALFAGFVKAAALKLGVAVSQGAYWPKFKDYPHTELLNWRKMRS